MNCDKYITAQEAYDSIGIGKIFNKRLAGSALKKYMKFCLEAEINVNLVESLKKYRSLQDLINFYNNEFKRESKLRLVGTLCPVRIGLTDDYRIVVWYDEYVSDNTSVKNKEIVDIINKKCDPKGIGVEYFERKYPSIDDDKGCSLNKENFYSTGYKRIRRGCLMGLIISILD